MFRRGQADYGSRFFEMVSAGIRARDKSPGIRSQNVNNQNAEKRPKRLDGQSSGSAVLGCTG